MRGSRALVGVTIAMAALTATAASAQVSYRTGDAAGSVTVNLEVLDSLGPMPTVPEMLRPGTPVGEAGYDTRTGGTVGSGRSGPAPELGVDGAPAPDWLRRPDAPRYAPPPETLARAATAAPRQSGPAPSLKPPSAAERPAAATPAAIRAAAPAQAIPAPTAPQTAAPQSAAPKATPTPPAAPRAAPPAAPAAPTTAARAPEQAAPPPPPPASAAAASAPPPPPVPTGTTVTQVAVATPMAPTAAIPAPSGQSTGDVVRVPFDADQSALPDAVKASLDALATRLRKDESLRVQLLAYADGDQDNANKARRLSLSRALTVRAYLIDKQVQSTRMDVRALGNRAKDSPKDRVDVVLVSR